jgi:Cysteine-rich secretory protein family
MTLLRRTFLAFALLLASLSVLRAQSDSGHQPEMAEKLLALTNQARTGAGLQPLTVDPALAAAAMKHCERMSVEGALEHIYPGELDLGGRASLAGVHFSLIEENIAFGHSPGQIHDEWMHSEGHRQNLLSSEVNHVGIAVIAHHGNLYAVADFTRSTSSYTPEQAEAQIASLIRSASAGIRFRTDPADARNACALDHGIPNKLSGGDPGYVMRWQNADLSQLPPQLAAQLSSGHYQQAAVGACPARGVEGGFTQYRMAVLLY